MRNYTCLLAYPPVGTWMCGAWALRVKRLTVFTADRLFKLSASSRAPLAPIRRVTDVLSPYVLRHTCCWEAHVAFWSCSVFPPFSCAFFFFFQIWLLNGNTCQQMPLHIGRWAQRRAIPRGGKEDNDLNKEKQSQTIFGEISLQHNYNKVYSQKWPQTSTIFRFKKNIER